MKLPTSIVAVALALGIAVPDAIAAPPDARPITLSVPSAPGGSNDIVARLVAPLLSGELGQPVVVENRAGAGGNLGASYAARVAANSNVWLLTTSSIMTINPALYRNPGFDTARDFLPVSGLATVPHVLLLHKDFAPSTLSELVSTLRKAPGQYFFGSPGNGTYAHVLMELLKRTEGVDASHVPFKGVAPAMTELMAGRIQMLISTLPSALPYIQSGDVKAVAVFSDQRSELLPSLPTAQETIPGLVGDLWIALYAPRTTTAAEVDRMRRAVSATLAKPVLQQQFQKAGATTLDLNPEKLGQLTAADLNRWIKVIRESRIQVD